MTMFEADHPVERPTDRGELRLSGLQEALSRALEREGGDLLTIYLGALYVLQQVKNPDRLALASHNFRELMDQIILHVRADVGETTVSLTSKVGNLRDDWDRTAKKTSCLNGDGNWMAEIDMHLSRFLRKVTVFFEWFNVHHPKRAKEIAGALQGFDPVGIPLPHALAKLNVNMWDKIRDFFLGVGHHGKKVSEDDFIQWQYAFERFLLGHLQPPTFEHHAELDELIEKGETRDS